MTGARIYTPHLIKALKMAIIAEAMKSDAQKTYERNSQPVIEEKNRAIGKTYMSNFLLRKALSMAVSSDEVTNNE